jgi:hypothetical protein
MRNIHVSNDNGSFKKKKKNEQHGPYQKTGGINSGAREGLAIPASYKAPAVLLINTVKSSHRQ